MRPISVVVLLLVSMTSSSCYQQSDCLRGDFSSASDYDSSLRDLLDMNWVSDAKACTLGQYLVYAPGSGDSDHLSIVRRDHKNMIILDGESLGIFQGPKFLALFGNRDSNGMYHSMSLTTENSSGSVVRTILDFDLDGIPDSRTSYDKTSGKSRRESQIAGEWHEIVERDGQWGYMVESTFYPMKQGKSKLLAIAAAAQRSRE